MQKVITPLSDTKARTAKPDVKEYKLTIATNISIKSTNDFFKNIEQKWTAIDRGEQIGRAHV